MKFLKTVLNSFCRDYRLTPREREVLEMVCTGTKNAAMARRLCRSEPTVRMHLRNVYRKTGAADKVELVLRVWQWSLQRESATRQRKRPGNTLSMLGEDWLLEEGRHTGSIRRAPGSVPVRGKRVTHDAAISRH